jgi:nucleotide-binding universal stress UspA family protein
MRRLSREQFDLKAMMQIHSRAGGTPRHPWSFGRSVAPEAAPRTIVIRASGTSGMQKPKRILVGLKKSEHAVELTNLACRVAARGASLLLVHVIELPDQTPLDADIPDLESTARRVLGAGERVARRARLKTKSLIVRSHSAGLALLEELKEKRNDLAVIGYHHPHTLGEVLFGTTARHVIAHAPCRILLTVPARE